MILSLSIFKIVKNKNLELQLGYDNLYGLKKHEVIELLGHGYNDINSNVFRYFIPQKKLWQFKYVYIYFDNNEKVTELMFSVFRKNLINKIEK